MPDQRVYYSRQVYLQNFTIVQGHSKSTLDKSTVTSFCWIEKEYNRVSKMIASCVIDRQVKYGRYEKTLLEFGWFQTVAVGKIKTELLSL